MLVTAAWENPPPKRATSPILDELRKRMADLSDIYIPDPIDLDGEPLHITTKFSESAEIILPEEIWNRIIDLLGKTKRPPRQNMTRKQARETGAIIAKTDTLALPSHTLYIQVLTPIANHTGFLLPIVPQIAALLRLINGKLYYKDQEITIHNHLKGNNQIGYSILSNNHEGPIR